MHRLVVIVDELRGGSVGNTDIGRDNLVTVIGIIDILTHIVEHLHLGVGLRETGRELIGHLYRLRGIGQGGDSVLLLELLDGRL